MVYSKALKNLIVLEDGGKLEDLIKNLEIEIIGLSDGLDREV